LLIKYAGLLLQDLRGLVVQQGGSKALIPMALDGTDKGTRCAAQALARIGITQVGELQIRCSVFRSYRIMYKNEQHCIKPLPATKKN
jgi:hypothetical protein